MVVVDGQGPLTNKVGGATRGWRETGQNLNLVRMIDSSEQVKEVLLCNDRLRVGGVCNMVSVELLWGNKAKYGERVVHGGFNKSSNNDYNLVLSILPMHQ